MTEDTLGQAGDIDVSPSKLLIKFGKPIATYAWHWLRGYKIVLLGPPLAGKTRFFRFLYTLQLVRDHKNDFERAADRTLEVSQLGLVVLRIGEGGGVVLPLRAVVDTPGRNDGDLHADYVVDTTQSTSGAHALIVILDGSDRAGSISWIKEFGDRLIQVLADADRLCELFVLINKYDNCVADYDDVHKEVFGALKETLEPVVGASKAKSIKILPTILVKHEKAADLLNTVFQQLAFTLKRKSRERTFGDIGGASK